MRCALPSGGVRATQAENAGINLGAALRSRWCVPRPGGGPSVEFYDVRETGGPPLLAGAIGWLTGHVSAEIPAGEDTFFVGEVLSVEQGARERPLVYVDRRYVSG